MITAQELLTQLKQGLPDADITVDDPYNDGTHFSATVISPHFAGLNKVQQHRAVYAVLGNAFDEDLHALQLTTRAK